MTNLRILNTYNDIKWNIEYRDRPTLHWKYFENVRGGYLVSERGVHVTV